MITISITVYTVYAAFELRGETSLQYQGTGKMWRGLFAYLF